MLVGREEDIAGHLYARQNALGLTILVLGIGIVVRKRLWRYRRWLVAFFVGVPVVGALIGTALDLALPTTVAFDVPALASITGFSVSVLISPTRWTRGIENH